MVTKYTIVFVHHTKVTLNRGFREWPRATLSSFLTRRSSLTVYFECVYLYVSIMFPVALLYLQLGKSIFFSLSSYPRSFISGTIFVACLCTPSMRFLSFSSLGGMRHSRILGEVVQGRWILFSWLLCQSTHMIYEWVQGSC